MKWHASPDPLLKTRLIRIINHLGLPHLLARNIFVFRSSGSKGRAIARIWSLPKIWQQALGIAPYYVIEVISEKFDRMRQEDQDRTLIHELMHIPKTFSGALVPHRGRNHRIDSRTVEVLYQKYLSSQKS